MAELPFDPDPLAASRRRSATELQARFAIERREVAYLAYRDQEDLLQLVELIAVPGREFVIGRARDVDVSLNWDPDVSTVHATIKPLGPAWVLEDVGSLNGTYVNEQRLVGTSKLVDRDLIRAGETHVAYRAAIPAGEATPVTPTLTRVSSRPPSLSVNPGERLVLIELCRPLLEADGLPASTPTNTEIAEKLFMAKGTVANHLHRLSGRLGIRERHGVQRELLAREAIRLQLVTRRDLRP